ncbi:MAG: DUF4065 domain-containing protein [Bacilli bacterium]|nr:DUF4065 domain-containing protein [Bacilli bacterium]
MEKLSRDMKFCHACLKEHEVDTVAVTEESIFRGKPVSFQAVYDYCSNLDQLLETEELIKINQLSLIDAYRKEVNLLTSDEIRRIREKYGVSQKDFSEILNWGEVTIIRYENHQIQDQAHDEVMRKIGTDTQWFKELLVSARERLSEKRFKKYLDIVLQQMALNKSSYIESFMEASISKYDGTEYNGGTSLQLPLVVDMINYLAKKVDNLFEVKLMKLLFYADFYHYKMAGKGISGLVYMALPMGAAPDNYRCLLDLENVNFIEKQEADFISRRFVPTANYQSSLLSDFHKLILDRVIEAFKDKKTDEIVISMHNEDAYKNTSFKEPISYNYAKTLSID